MLWNRSISLIERPKKNNNKNLDSSTFEKGFICVNGKYKRFPYEKCELAFCKHRKRLISAKLVNISQRELFLFRALLSALFLSCPTRKMRSLWKNGKYETSHRHKSGEKIWTRFRSKVPGKLCSFIMRVIRQTDWWLRCVSNDMEFFDFIFDKFISEIGCDIIFRFSETLGRWIVIKRNRLVIVIRFFPFAFTQKLKVIHHSGST